ncbi:MAG: Gldg family protein [Spirochaetia bacterium]|jgi:hypothetical protein|nr:Gldg family protein [Spirochaetia bacterium]
MKEIIAKIIDSLKKTTGASERSVQIVLTVIIILLVNFAAATCNMRCDLTRSNSYSLSKKSKTVVRDLRENMKIKVFFSENLPPQHMTVFRYLKDILDEYDYYGSRNFSYEIVPEKDLEREAGSYGIQPIQSQEFDNDQTTLRRAYMGLVIQHADLLEKINALTNTSGLEYEITSRMEKMAAKVNSLLKLEKPITVRLYHDSRLKSLPINGIDKLEQLVSEAVQASAAINYNKLVFESADTANDPDIEKTARAYGLNILQWKAGGTANRGLLAIVLINDSKFKAINLELPAAIFGGYTISGIEHLEDNINDSIPPLLGGSQKIGYLAEHGTVDINDSRGNDGGAVLKEILSDYELVPISLTGDIPSGISTLIINAPRGEFAPAELYRLDQYLMAGNSALVFIDSFEEINNDEMSMFRQQSQPVTIPVDSGLDEILRHYGVTVEKNIVLDDNCAKINLGQMIKDYPLLPVILKNGFSRKNVITKYLNSAAMYKVSPLEYDSEKLKERGITAETLIASSKESRLMGERVDFNPFMLETGKSDELKSYPLSVELSGKFESFFKGKDTPLKEEQGALNLIHRLDETIEHGKTRLIVTGTSQITRSEFLLNSRKILAGSGEEGEAFSNEILIHGMADYLTGNDYIPEMKSKSLAYNPIDKQSASWRFVLKAINIAGAPILVIVWGLIAWRRWKNRKILIHKKFSEAS